MPRKILQLAMKGRVNTCPACGYDDGFHVSFSVKKTRTDVVLICPMCSSRFKTKWTIDMSGQQ